MQTVMHDHRSGRSVVPQALLQEVTAAVEACTVTPSKGVTEQIRSSILGVLYQHGWSGEVKLESAISDISITSVKDGVGLCVQTGNMSRLYADLLKLQSLFLRQAIGGGVMVVPTLPASRALGSNVAHFDRLCRELEIFSQVITMPIVVVGIQ